jgi:hypothetical protein
VRRFTEHAADADIDAGLAKINRCELSVGVGEMQDADIAEAADVVEIVVSSETDAGKNSRQRRGGESLL